MRTRKVKKTLAPGIKRDVLKAIHDAGYVCNESLAAILRVHPVISWRALKDLEKRNLIRLVGEPIKCSHRALRGKRFYTPTSADLKDVLESQPGTDQDSGSSVPDSGAGYAPESEPQLIPINVVKREKITPFRPYHGKYDPEETLAGAYILLRRFIKEEADPKLESKVKGVKKKRNRKQEAVIERAPLHRCGTNVAVGFFASVVNMSSDTVDTFFKPELMLRREKSPTYPMPDGIFLINKDPERQQESMDTYLNCYRIEFEVYKKTRARYEELFKLLEKNPLPTVYVVLTVKMAEYLDELASNKKNIIVAMLGDTNGLISAMRGLNEDCYWQGPERIKSGKLAGFDRPVAEAPDDDARELVPPPGLRHLDDAAIAKRKEKIEALLGL